MAILSQGYGGGNCNQLETCFDLRAQYAMSKTRNPNTAPSDKSLKEILIEVSEKIIEEDGLGALSLRAAARAAGVSHMAPYRHFEDKDSLLASVAGKGFLGLANAMATSSNDQNDPIDRLHSIGITYVHFAYSNRGLFRLMFSAGITDRARFAGLTAAGEVAFSVCANAVSDCYTSADDPGPEVLHRRALNMWSLVHGLGTLMIDDHIDLKTSDPVKLRSEIGAILEESRGWLPR